MKAEINKQFLKQLGFSETERPGYVGTEGDWGSIAVGKVVENLQTLRDLGYVGVRIADAEYMLYYFEGQSVEDILAKRAALDIRLQALRALTVEYIPEASVSTAFMLVQQVREYLGSLTSELVSVTYDEVSEVLNVSHDHNREFGTLTLSVKIGTRKVSQIILASEGGKDVGDPRANLFYRIDIQVLKKLVNS